jgi:hypothetical protein
VTNNVTLKLQIPKTEAEWKVIAKEFKDQWNFPFLFWGGGGVGSGWKACVN